MRLVSVLRHVRRTPPAVLVVFSVGLACTPVGCATQINSPSQSVLFFSDPPGAEVWVDDRVHVITPGKVQLSRLSSHNARVEKVGYQPVAVELDRGMSLWTLVDIVCLPLVVKCIYDDVKDGGFYSFDDEIHVTLTGLPAPPSKSRFESRLPPRSESSVESPPKLMPKTALPEELPDALPEDLPEPEPAPLAP
jgi:hypothetical protein